MNELITELRRKESGLYDMKIRTSDGRVLFDLRGLSHNQAMRMIDEAEQKEDDGKKKI